MQENEQNADRTDILHQEQVEVEEASAQLAPVGKLVMNDLMRYYPAYEDASQEPHYRQEDLTRDKIKPVK